jgi:hypothetical protein
VKIKIRVFVGLLARIKKDLNSTAKNIIFGLQSFLPSNVGSFCIPKGICNKDVNPKTEETKSMSRLTDDATGQSG